MMATCFACPECRKNLTADCMTLQDGRVKAWGYCECGYRIGAGIAKSVNGFDVEAAVEKALERDGVIRCQ